MNGADAVIFAGGIGENSAKIRQLICENLSWMGILIDDKQNAKMIHGKEGIISKKNAKLKIFVIPTNEELLIARDTVRLIS